jgi:hypothetical protein
MSTTKKSFIYLAMACTTYEGDRVIAAFAREQDAKALIDKCIAHQAKKPECPDVIEDTPENDALHEKWFAKHGRWKKRHPAGEFNADFDSYIVVKVPFFAAPKEPA